MSGRLERSFQILLHVEDTPHRIALAFGIGVFIAFFPIWGVHTAMALGIAFLFRLSRAATLIGAYLNNPWTMAPMYTAGTLLGCGILGVSPHGLAGIEWRYSSLRGVLLEALKPYLWPFVLGNTLLGVVSAVVAYVVLRELLERRRP